MNEIFLCKEDMDFYISWEIWNKRGDIRKIANFLYGYGWVDDVLLLANLGRASHA